MQIYYFTRSGRSEKIAHDIGKNLQISAIEIKDNKNWSGPINFLKGGAASSKKEKVEIDCPEPEGKVILIFPIWAGSFPPAVRTFIDNYDREKIIAVPTSLGTTLRDRDGFLKIIDLVGKEIKAPLNGQIL